MAERNVAQEVLEKVESGLECGICFDTYTEPKVLPCFHVFCSECLKKSVEKGQDKKTLSCPNCRHSVPLPTNGIEGLQSAFHISHLFDIRDTLTKSKDSARTKCEKCDVDSIATGYCQECGEFVCNECTKIHKLWKKQYGAHTIVSMTDIQTQAANLIPPKRKELFCKKHPEERLKIFCETCQEVACFYCTIRDHQNHQHDTVQNSFQKNREEIERELLPVKRQREKLEEARKDFEVRAGEIAENEARIGAKTKKRIDRYCQILQERKAELLTQLEHAAQQKQKRLAAQKESVDLRLAQIDNCIGYIEGSLKTNSQEEILSVKATTLKQLHFLATDFKEDMMTPEEQAILDIMMTDIGETCQKLGEVVDGTPVCPEKCFVDGDGVKVATVKEQQEVTLKLVGDMGDDITIPPNEITAKLVKTSDQTVVKCSVSKMKTECRIQYTPKERGEHQLHLKVQARHVQNSPLSVAVMPALEKPIATFPNLHGAWGISITSIGHLVVAEAHSNQVTILTQDGKKIKSFGNRGSANGQFNYPGGITIDNDDNIYVADAYNNRIQKFQMDGTFLAATIPQSDINLQSPYGVTFNKLDGNLYVCDTNNHRIQVLNTELHYVRTVGMEGGDTQKLSRPLDVAFDSKGNTYVANQGNKCIQVLTATGKYSHTIGANTLKDTYGVTVDAAGRVYVVEHSINKISVFTQAGDYIRSFATIGNLPLRIAIETENMCFFVSTFGGNSVHKF